MILIESGARSPRGFEAKVLFAAQLDGRGHAVTLDDAWLPEDLDRSLRYDAAPYLRALDAARVTRLIVIGAETLADEVLIRLRQIGLPGDIPATLVGRFETRQAQISAQSKLAYVLGREPDLIDLSDAQPHPLAPDLAGPAAGLGVTRPANGGEANLFVILPEAALEDASTLPALMAMEHQPGLRLHIVLPRRARDHLKTLRFTPARLFGMYELSPATLARLADMAAIFAADMQGDRIAVMATEMMASGGIVVDCTPDGTLAGSTAPILRGPHLLPALADYLRQTVLPNRDAIAAQVTGAPWTGTRRIDALERLIGLEPPARETAPRPPRTLFLPTNGNGLGHARRCTLIAREMTGTKIGFAAFPSCLPMIRAEGHDCLPLISKSAAHDTGHANDLVNYMRLRRALHPGDRLVFDGGYVFDSIYRTILEKDLDATWIRRGLWQAGQITPAALHREGVFRRVIVPEEAFDELNADMTFGRHIHKVGPIVGDRPERPADAIRADLARGLGRDFTTLVVTMLGGGVAADRTAQMQMLAALMERRPDCLHLILIWPGSVVPPALYGWKNTTVCQTRNAAAIAAAADLVVTAAGYNSFHEVLYHGLPAIFIPQMAGFMDDQARRAQAAADRGLAVTLGAGEMLLLEREVTAILEDGKGAELRAALSMADLPARGNARAAGLIAAEDWT